MSEAKSFHLPDLVALGGSNFELRTNRHCHQATSDTRKWAQTFLDPEEQGLMASLELGLLSSLSFPTCDFTQLVIVTKCFVLLLHWKTKGLDLNPELFDGLWESLSRVTPLEWQERFRQNLNIFRDSRSKIDDLRTDTPTLDFDSFLALRRRLSGVDVALDLIEYAEDLHITKDVVDDPVLSQLRRDTGDIVLWANDVAAYNVKQASGDFNNLVAVLMLNKDLSIQPAIHAARKYLQEAIERFLKFEKLLPSWGDTVDADVRMLVRGFRDWIIGSLHWIYETDRYFQGHGDDIRQFGWVFLLSKDSLEESTM